MNKKTAPYKTIALWGSILVMIYVGWVYQFGNYSLPTWVHGVVIALSVGVLLAVILEISTLLLAYRRKHLYPFRNASLFIFFFSIIVLPIWGIYSLYTGESLRTEAILLLPTFLYFSTQNLNYLRFNDISLEAKVGLSASRVLPLFSIKDIEKEDRLITIIPTEGPNIDLFRPFFFSSHWLEINQRLTRLTEPKSID